MTTTAMNSGSLSVRTWEKSMLAAVSPPTWTSRLVPCSACGMRVSRRLSTRLMVWLACGLVVG